MESNKILEKLGESIKNRSEEIEKALVESTVGFIKLMAELLIENEVNEKVGKRYKRNKRYSRWGTNPGSIWVDEEKVRIEVPRIKDKENNKVENAEIYSRIRKAKRPKGKRLRKLILGLSQNRYEEAVKELADSFGLSQSSLSREFIEESSRILEEFQKRDLSKYDFVSIMIDGKYLAKEQMIIAVGITVKGEKIPLEFIQSTTENSLAVKGLLQRLIERNLRFEEGLLVVCDGSKGIIKAVKEVFGEYVLIQRCQWHKRENVVSYLNEEIKERYRRKIQLAYYEPDYKEAKGKLLEIIEELKDINLSASRSLEEGLEETLTLHRLGLVEELGKSLTTTNIIENVNSGISRILRNVKFWRNSSMRARWIAIALVDLEQRMKRIKSYRKLPKLREAIKKELRLKEILVA